MNCTDSAAIMVIGDDSDFCYLMRRYVRKAAYRSVFVHLSEDVLALASHLQPAAIIVEGDLADGAGRRALSALKAAQATHGIPVALCSWLDEEACGAEEGADVYLRKPILYEDFIEALVDMGIRPLP